MASGVNEHNEARRKEHIYLRKAWVDLQRKEREQLEPGNAANYKPSSYDFEAQRKANLGLVGGRDSESVDRQRRMAHYKQMQEDYSAKIPHRYSSNDYISQW